MLSKNGDGAITITAATAEQAGLVHQIMQAAYAEYLGKLTPPSGAHAETVEDVARAMREGGALLAWLDGAAVGPSRHALRADHFYIGRVAVLAVFRGRGIESSMMASLEDIARATGYTEIRLGVRGTIDGYPYRGSLAPYSGVHYLGVRREIREAIDKGAGDTVHVVMEEDSEPRVVATPEDLQRALDESPQAKAAYEKLSHSHRKEYVDWIGEAKKPETRAKRILKTVEMLIEGKK